MIDRSSSLGEILEACNALAAQMEADSQAIDAKLKNKLDADGVAKDSIKFNGKESSEFVMKADLKNMHSTEMVDNTSTVTLKYSTNSPINKFIEASEDITIEFKVDENEFAVPVSAIYIEATNSAKIQFKNATLLQAQPDVSEEYSVVVYVSKIGSKWIVSEIKPILGNDNTVDPEGSA